MTSYLPLKTVVICLIAIACLLAGCSSEQPAPVPETGTATLDSLLRADLPADAGPPLRAMFYHENPPKS